MPACEVIPLNSHGFSHRILPVWDVGWMDCRHKGTDIWDAVCMKTREISGLVLGEVVLCDRNEGKLLVPSSFLLSIVSKIEDCLS